MKRDLLAPFASLAVLLFLTGAAAAQAPGAASAIAISGPSAAQLDQLLAAIALYPDPLLASMLMASTYPLDVVDADHWRHDPANAALTGDRLAAALAAQPWDPSVKSLVQFPSVLELMDSNIGWTERLGEAFVAAPDGVIQSIQRLRRRAQAAGTLVSNAQQTVASAGDVLTIEPAQADLVAPPVYGGDAFGDWPYPDYPPYYFLPPGVDLASSSVGFFPAVAIVTPLWGWQHCDWRHHRIMVDVDRFNAITPGGPVLAGGIWQHDPAQRRRRTPTPPASAAVMIAFPPPVATAPPAGFIGPAPVAAQAVPLPARKPGSRRVAAHRSRRAAAARRY
jgi:hypothetical protein